MIDFGSVRELGLDRLIDKKDSRLFGLLRDPVQVTGKLDLVLYLGDKQVWNTLLMYSKVQKRRVF